MGVTPGTIVPGFLPRRPDALPARPLALVTGASMGIGAALARELARQGHDLVLTARSADRLEALSSELEVLGARTHVIPLDLLGEGALDHLSTALQERQLDVDVLVNNAGFGTHGATLEVPLEQDLSMVELLLDVPVRLTRLIAPGMIERGRGRILQVASTAAFQPCPGYALYGATKAALLSWSNALHAELAGTGVTCTTLCPGPTETAFLEKAGHRPGALQRRTLMSAERVARIAVKGLMRGRPTVTPGFANWIGAVLATRFPRTWATATAGRLLRNSPQT